MVQKPQDLESSADEAIRAIEILRMHVRNTLREINSAMKHEENELKSRKKTIEGLRDSAKNFERDLQQFRGLSPEQKQSRFGAEQIKLRVFNEEIQKERNPLLHLYLGRFENLVESLRAIIQREAELREAITNLRINTFGRELQQ